MKYSFIKRSLALLVFVSVFSMSYANENVIYLKKGDSTSIPCPSCTAVGVDNPNISDVAVDEDSVVLSAIEPGTTSVTVISLGTSTVTSTISGDGVAVGPQATSANIIPTIRIPTNNLLFIFTFSPVCVDRFLVLVSDCATDRMCRRHIQQLGL